MRFIRELAPDTVQLLERIYKRSRHPRTRQRAQWIFLSYEGYSAPELARIFRVTQVTIYTWFTTWETRRFPGLYDRPGKGNTPKLTTAQQEQVKTWAQTFPKERKFYNIPFCSVWIGKSTPSTRWICQSNGSSKTGSYSIRITKQLRKIGDLLKETFEIEVSPWTIRRILKALGVTWRRVRRKVHRKPDPQEYESKKQELEQLQEQHDKGEIDLRCGDQSGCGLIPLIPYAWQLKGATIELPASSSRKRLNVIGFFNTSNALQAYPFECTIDSDIMIACMDDFCHVVTKKTVLALDQASIHTSDAFMDRIPVWKEQGVEIFHLPPYSPQLNLIEILWRFIKYEWLDFAAYESWKHLVDYVEEVLRNVGTEYKINFA